MVDRKKIEQYLTLSLSLSFFHLQQRQFFGYLLSQLLLDKMTLITNALFVCFQLFLGLMSSPRLDDFNTHTNPLTSASRPPKDTSQSPPLTVLSDFLILLLFNLVLTL